MVVPLEPVSLSSEFVAAGATPTAADARTRSFAADHMQVIAPAIVGVMIAVFAVSALMRLNTFELYNPDSAGYVIYGTGLAYSGDYRVIDRPGQPLYTWRPPGLPLLMAPLLRVFPYSVIAAKLLILFTSVMLLLVLSRLVARIATPWWTIAITALVASNPLFLVLSTEVMAEVPYALMSLLLIRFWLGHNSGDANIATAATKIASHPATNNTTTFNVATPRISSDAIVSILAIAAALSMLVMLRGVGIALVAATGIAALLAGRWRTLAAVAMSAMVFGWWTLRNRAVGANDYADSIFARLQTGGISAVLNQVFSAADFYAGSWSGLVFPGLVAGRPGYAAVGLERVPYFSLLTPLFVLLTAALTAIALFGAWRRRHHEGRLILLYALLYCGALSVWGWRDERFLWPLLPFFWIYLAVGWQQILDSGLLQSGAMIGAMLGAAASKNASGDANTVGGVIVIGLQNTNDPMAAGSKWPRGWLLVTATVLLVAWQQFGEIAILQANFAVMNSYRRAQAATNVDSRRALTADLPYYFADWRAAGSWIAANTAPTDRLLVSHPAVGETAHRFQRRVMFETQSPEDIRKAIQQFHATYLVVPTGSFGDGFGWQQALGDPAYRFAKVHEVPGAAILQVTWNTAGNIDPNAYTRWADVQLNQLTSFLKDQPHRTDLVTRQANLLVDVGRHDEAVAALKSMVAAGHKDVRVYADLGYLLLDTGKFDEAAKYLSIARTLPYSEAIAEQLSAAIQLARTRAAATAAGDLDSDAVYVSRARNEMGRLKIAAARSTLETVLARQPSHPEAHYLMGVAMQWCGERDKAAIHYQTAADLGSTDAARRVQLLKWLVAFENDRATTILDVVEPVSAGASEPITDADKPRAKPNVTIERTVSPTSVADRIELARRLTDARLYGQAVVELQRGTLMPNITQTQLTSIGESLLQLGEWTSAEVAFRMAVNGAKTATSASAEAAVASATAAGTTDPAQQTNAGQTDAAETDTDAARDRLRALQILRELRPRFPGSVMTVPSAAGESAS